MPNQYGTMLLELIIAQQEKQRLRECNKARIDAETWLETAVERIGARIRDTEHDGDLICIIDTKGKDLTTLEHIKIALLNERLGIDIMSKARIRTTYDKNTFGIALPLHEFKTLLEQKT